MLQVSSSPQRGHSRVTIRMVDTLDSRSEPPRMQIRFFSSGIAEQRTFSIGGSGWSILASYRGCFITRAKASTLCRAEMKSENSHPPYQSDPGAESLRTSRHLRW